MEVGYQEYEYHMTVAAGCGSWLSRARMPHGGGCHITVAAGSGGWLSRVRMPHDGGCRKRFGYH